MNDLLSIGQFAKLCETTTDTLIHYDNINLLPPARISDKNRRLYSIKQYKLFCTIQILTETGMPLNTIRELLDDSSTDLLSATLKETERAFKKKLFYLQNTIMHIDDMQILSSVMDNTASGQPIIYMQNTPQNMFATLVPNYPADSKELAGIIKKHMDACKKESVYPFPLGCIIKKESPCRKNSKSFLLTSHLRTGMSDNRTPVQAAGQYAAILHKGSFDTITESIHLLQEYILAHSFRILSDTYITVYNSPLSVEQKEFYLIKIRIETI